MEKKNGTVNKVIIFALIAVIAIGIPVSFFLHLKNQMKWSPVNDLSEAKRTRYASLCLIPGFENNIEKVYIRGLRDADYRVETKNYGSIEELYAILPFKDKESSKEAQKALAEAEEKDLEKADLGNVSKVYRADILPLTKTDKDGKELLESYYRHEYYVVCDGDGYRFVFIVHMM